MAQTMVRSSWKMAILLQEDDINRRIGKNDSRFNGTILSSNIHPSNFSRSSPRTDAHLVFLRLLSQSSIQLSDLRQNSWKLTTSKRTLHAQASSKDDLNMWMSAIGAAIEVERDLAEHPERSERFWTPGTTFLANTGLHMPVLAWRTAGGTVGARSIGAPRRFGRPATLFGAGRALES